MDAGFAQLVVYILRLQADGMIWWAPPCSSWVWINRGTAKRSKTNVLGDCSLDYVAAADKMGFASRAPVVARAAP